MLKQTILVMLLGVSLPGLAKGDINAGQQKAMMCAACHGITGKSSAAPYPSLAGQSSTYLIEALHAYQNGQRSGGQAEIMKAYAAELSNQDIENLADWYASQKSE